MWILGLKGLKRDPWIFHFSSTIPMDVYGSWFVDVNSLLTFTYQGTMISTNSRQKQKLLYLALCWDHSAPLRFYKL